MIQDLALRWFVTILFVLAAGECLYALAAGKRRPAAVIGQLLHVVMGGGNGGDGLGRGVPRCPPSRRWCSSCSRPDGSSV